MEQVPSSHNSNMLSHRAALLSLCRLRQLRNARKQLRDLNTALKHELDAQADGMQEVSQLLTTIRGDLDASHTCIR
jgi:hypothetical protein